MSTFYFQSLSQINFWPLIVDLFVGLLQSVLFSLLMLASYCLLFVDHLCRPFTSTFYRQSSSPFNFCLSLSTYFVGLLHSVLFPLHCRPLMSTFIVDLFVDLLLSLFSVLFFTLFCWPFCRPKSVVFWLSVFYYQYFIVGLYFQHCVVKLYYRPFIVDLTLSVILLLVLTKCPKNLCTFGLSLSVF